MKLFRGDGATFSGLATATEFADWARRLTRGVQDIHDRLTIHGDICPQNILIAPDNRAVFIDVGQSLFREVITGANEFSTYFYRAPEGVRSPNSDLFSLGGIFYYLATGKDPIGLARAESLEAHKEQVALKIKAANPDLYHEDAGVSDITALCLRKHGRVQHAARLLRDIDMFWPEDRSISVVSELQAVTGPAAALDTAGNALYRFVAGSQLRTFGAMLANMSKGIYDESGSPTSLRTAASALLSTLGTGDEFVTISLPAFWYPDNIGVNGRFLSMCRNAAARGASVKRVLMIDDSLSDPHLQAIVSAQLAAASDVVSSLRINLAVRFVLMTADKRRHLVATGKHFGLLVKGTDRIAMWPVYDAADKLITLRFRSGDRQVEGLRESFDTLWGEARPLVDLNLPNLSFDFMEGAS
jgi:hypothetical protein